MMTIGLTFFLRSLQTSRVRHTAGKAGDELIEVGLKRGDLHLIKGGSTDGVVHRQRFLDTLGTGGQASPVDKGASRLLDRGDDRGEGNGHPALDQGADDEHTQDGSALGDLAHQTTGEVLGDGGADLVAKLLRVPQESVTDNVPREEEQQRTDDAARTWPGKRPERPESGEG